MILLCLGAQFVVGFKLLCPPRSLPALEPLRLVCSPAAWPFLDFNMYVAAHYEGEEVSRYRVYGRDAAGQRQEILPQDFGLEWRDFKRQVIRPLRDRDHAGVGEVARRYTAATGNVPRELELRRLFLIVARGDGPFRREEDFRRYDLEALPR